MMEIQKLQSRVSVDVRGKTGISQTGGAEMWVHLSIGPPLVRGVRSNVDLVLLLGIPSL